MHGAWKILSWAAGKGDEEEASKFSSGSDFTSPVKNSWIPGVGPDEEEFVNTPGQVEDEEMPGSPTSSKSSSASGHGRSDPSSSWADADIENSSQSSLVSLGEEPEDPLAQRFRKFLSDAEAAVTPPSPSYGNTHFLMYSHVGITVRSHRSELRYFQILCVGLIKQS